MTKVCETCGKVLASTELRVIDGKKLHWNSTFTQDMADRICAGITGGLSLKALCEQEGMPDLTTVIRWRREHPSFALAYARAREESADAFADEIMAIADDRGEDWVQDLETGTWKPNHDHINRAKLRVDARKWIAAKLKPASYGDRVEQLIKGELTTRSLNVTVDASSMTMEQRQLLRMALLPPPAADDEGDT